MKKLLSGMFVIAIALITINVNALTNYKSSDWKTEMPKEDGGTETLGTVTPEGKNKTILTGNAVEAGMGKGPFLEGGNTTIGEGIEEALYIGLDTKKIKHQEYFEISLSFKDPKQTAHFGYANEINVRTENMDGENIAIEYHSGKTGEWVKIANVTKEDIYKYDWKITRENNQTKLTITISDSTDKIIGSKSLIMEEEFPIGSTGDIKELTDASTIRWIWFCNIQTNNVEVYNKQDIVVADSNVTSEDKNLNDILTKSLEESGLVSSLPFTDINVDVVLDEEKEVTTEIKSTMEKEASEKFSNIKLAKFFDISIEVKGNNEVLGHLTKLTDKINLTVKVPTDLPKLDEGYNRKYYIIRDHEGTITVLDATVSKDGKTLTFASDEFSTYAIAYVDNKIATNTVTTTQAKAENPKTLDTIMIYTGTGLLSLLAISFIGYKSIKKVKKA